MANAPDSPKAAAPKATAPAAKTAAANKGGAGEPFVTGKPSAAAAAATAKPAGAGDAKKPDGAEKPAGADFKSVISNLSQMSSFKNLASIIGDGAFAVADKIVTTAKKAWNSFLHARLESVTMRDAVIRIFTSATKPLRIVAKFAGRRLKRARTFAQNMYKKYRLAQIKRNPGVKLAEAGTPGVTNGAVAPPQAGQPQSALPQRRKLGQTFGQEANPATARRPQSKPSTGPSQDLAGQKAARERNTLNMRRV